ncbi:MULTISPECIES: sensor histidine kinase [Bacillus amyloliquefaciens group]|uniref:sensor histidine kinase n=1 Tax=Bacillus amyloliquefaciens group TaxID=1938374 RepID=UPI0005A352F1|nr:MULTISPECIES: HAMP domain-containing sensor histidine kinase [Bacillus amyloliquefaciens group]AJH25391.1 histidine kinase [Bacillus velezensis]AKD23523.1 histidine kinase [Bacillus velezensis]MCE4147975.1 HAMP domain-containing histidine kinase [Bacillus velezensis]QVL38958.1 HAMP domain-containing histidine kinase [Bacillus velezensis]UUA76447.1 HAMP domain-containing histidine kinase [Bacillus amyloliquefaciens]
MGIAKGKSSIRKELVKFTITLCLSTMGVAALCIALNAIAMNAGAILPANYSEHEAEQIKPRLKSAEKITEDMIPAGMTYAVFDKKTKRMTKGTMTEQDAANARKKIQHQPYFNYAQKGFMVINRKDEYGVLQYSLRSEFQSPLLRRYLPNYEWTGLTILITLLLLTVFIVTTRFANQLRRHFSTLSSITASIQKQNLNINPKRSRIKEFDDVIDSLLKMKDALQASLAAQWEAERIKKEQIGALAHDIKIPATIIKGNAELLQLTEPDEEQAEYAQYILDAGNKIEHYVGQLIQLSKAEEAVAVHVEYTDLKEWIQNIYRDAAALAGPKQIDLVLSERGIDRIEAPIDHELLHRAVMNIAANAVDYTPEGGEIRVDVLCTDSALQLAVSDSGSGFSPEALKRATQLFYTEDKSRHSAGHHGMGLTFAHHVVHLHHGELILENQESGGARAEIRIPLEGVRQKQALHA